MKTRRWRVGDATVFRIGELDATAALQGLFPKFDLSDVERAGWLIPAFVDQAGRLRGSVQVFLITHVLPDSRCWRDAPNQTH